MQLIADSGSTKTSWCLLAPSADTATERHFTSAGINPVRDDEAAILRELDAVAATLAHPDGTTAGVAETTLAHTGSPNAGVSGDALSKADGPAAAGTSAEAVTAVHFYGAGCIPSRIPLMERLLAARFPNARIHVASDLLGAARAICGHTEGIACILGTGSNSCLYDGHDIVANVPALGWILGDEGSGAVLGRTLVSDVLKRQLPDALCTAFLEQFHLTQDAIIQAVYRGEQPNRLLASFVPFIVAHRAHPAMHRLLTGAFGRFFQRNVLAYARPDLPVGFVGGIAAQFEPELHEAAAAAGLRIGRILRQPIAEMVRYHLND